MLRRREFDDLELVEELGFYDQSKLLVRFNLNRIPVGGSKYNMRSLAIPILVWEDVSGRRISEFVSRIGNCLCRGILIKRDDQIIECICCHKRVGLCPVCGEPGFEEKCISCGSVK